MFISCRLQELDVDIMEAFVAEVVKCHAACYAEASAVVSSDGGSFLYDLFWALRCFLVLQQVCSSCSVH